MIRRLARIGGRSLQRRFIAIVIVGTSLFALTGAIVALALAESRALAHSRHAVENVTSAVEKSLAIGAFASDRVLLQEIVSGLAGHELVRWVEVRGSDGVVLVSSGDATPLPLEPARALIERPLVSPFDASERVGTLRLRLQLSNVAKTAVEEALLLGGLMAGQVVLVALLLAAVVAWLVSGPIVRLARALPEMEPGSGRRLETPAFHRDDEIGLLVGAANALLDAHGDALQRERALRTEVETMEARYRQIFDASSAGIFVLGAGGRLINSNPTVSRVLGMSLEELSRLQHENFVRSVFARPEKVQRMVDEAGRSGRTMSADLQVLRDREIDRWVHCLISVQAGLTPATRTVEGVIYDVTERIFSERRVRHRAEHDALTGLKNRVATQAAVERLIAVAVANHTPGALLCIDLDGFKRVNDELGHRSGDQVLVTCAERMTASVRADGDVVGRVGGDEFIVALPGVGPGDEVLDRIASALLAALQRPIALPDGRSTAIGASIGIACAPHHATDYATLVEAADRAMYEVKRTGKNAYALAAARRPPGAIAAPPFATTDLRHAFDVTDF